MTMQTDVRSVHQHISGFAVLGRTRVKGLSVRGAAAAASRLDLFDTSTVPVAATYAQTGLVITVTKNAHGLTNGQNIGIAFDDGTGGTPNSGNFVITVVDANSFTVTSLNTDTITAGAVCRYAQSWMLTIEVASGDVFNNYQLLPGEGILARYGVYADLDAVVSFSIYIG